MNGMKRSRGPRGRSGRSVRDMAAIAQFERGGLLKAQGDLAGAERALSEATELQPSLAAAHVQLGEVLRQQGQFDRALACCGQGLALDPDLLEGRIIRGVIQSQRGELDAAIDDLSHVVARAPSVAALHVILGDMLTRRDRLDEALTILQKAVRLEPGNAGAAANLGTVLQKLGRDAEACEAYRKAIALDPSDARSHSNLAGMLCEIGAVEAAIAAARRAIALAPQFFGAYCNLAAALSLKGDLVECLAVYREALRRHPDRTELLGFICHLRQQMCDWGGLADDLEALRRTSYAKDKRTLPFNVLVASGSAAEHLKCARVWASAFGADVPAAEPRPSAGPGAGRHWPLRIGYLSGDFHCHATAMLIAEVFERHDKSRFVTFGYSLRRDGAPANGESGSSPMRQRLMAALDHFVDLRELSNAAAARRIAEDGIDVLIDLKGYTVDARPQILAARPVPIQVNFLGYPGSMGAPFIDYIVADAIVAPMAQAAFYDEKIVHLPHCYQPNDRFRAVAEALPSRAACGLPAEGFVFCCLNNSYKITPAIFDVWMRIMNGVPGSVLWLLDANGVMAANLRREAACRGVEPARLVFAARQSPDRHVARLALADLFLDTLPCNAHTTASEALWVGLPVLTCLGESFAGRVAASLLTAIGLPELIAESLADYEMIASRLARDPTELARLRRRLTAQRNTMPLFDTPRWTRHFEAALTRMIEIHEAGEPPRAFTIEAD